MTLMDTDVPWWDQAACLGKPLEFDLDVIGNDKEAVRAALKTCRHCPVLHQCREWTSGLSAWQRPKRLIQAGRVYESDGRVRR